VSIEDEELMMSTLRVLESALEFEKRIASDFNLFQKVLNLCLQTVEEEPQRALAVIGNVTSHQEFVDMLGLDRDISRANMLTDVVFGESDLGRVAIACIALGNLAVSSQVVTRLVSAHPHLIERVLEATLQMSNPFELQSAHLLKNISIDGKYKKQIVRGGASKLVDRLMSVQAFPTIRFLGAQLARNLVTDVEPVDRHVLQIVASVMVQEPDGTVRAECELALAAAVATLVNGENAGPYLDLCVRTLVRVMKVTDDPRLLLKTTKALGMAIVFKPELFATNEVRPYLTIHFDSASKIDTSTPQGRGASQNLAFLAAQVEKAFPAMRSVSEGAIRHAIADDQSNVQPGQDHTSVPVSGDSNGS
jgi:hypothetical protein